MIGRGGAKAIYLTNGEITCRIGQKTSANGEIPRAMMRKLHKRVENYLFRDGIVDLAPETTKIDGIWASWLDM